MNKTLKPRGFRRLIEVERVPTTVNNDECLIERGDLTYEIGIGGRLAAGCERHTL
jgi:hypothetical protein